MINTVCFLAITAALTLDGNAAARPRPDACRQTTDSASRACRNAATGDFWLASGKCANVAQRNARQAVCRRLGGAPYEPDIQPADFVAGVDNPYFPLAPGTTFVYEGQTSDGLERDTFAVTHTSRMIAGVACLEVRDTVTRDGELIEDTLDWFAQDREGNVWYFGENAKQLAGGLVIGVEGSWTAGIDGARPGIAMRARPGVGDFYRQEFSLGTAEDIGAVLELDPGTGERLELISIATD